MVEMQMADPVKEEEASPADMPGVEVGGLGCGWCGGGPHGRMPTCVAPACARFQTSPGCQEAWSRLP